MKKFLSFFFIATLCLGVGQPPETSSGKVESNREELNITGTVFKNGLLPLPEKKTMAVEPMPLPKEPTFSPELMPYFPQNKSSKKDHKKNDKNIMEDSVSCRLQNSSIADIVY